MDRLPDEVWTLLPPGPQSHLLTSFSYLSIGPCVVPSWERASCMGTLSVSLPQCYQMQNDTEERKLFPDTFEKKPLPPSLSPFS